MHTNVKSICMAYWWYFTVCTRFLNIFTKHDMFAHFNSFSSKRWWEYNHNSKEMFLYWYFTMMHTDKCCSYLCDLLIYGYLATHTTSLLTFTNLSVLMRQCYWLFCNSMRYINFVLILVACKYCVYLFV